MIINFNNSKEQKEILLNSDFLEWFAGFTDAEGNFNLTLTFASFAFAIQRQKLQPLSHSCL